MVERYLITSMRKCIGTWSCAVEAGRGGTVGVPDMLVLMGSELVPVEVKAGSVHEGRLWCRRIRPAQIAWHEGLRAAGGVSFVWVGMGSGRSFDVWAIGSVDRGTLSAWREGWRIEDCRRVITGGKMAVDLRALVAEKRKGI